MLKKRRGVVNELVILRNFWNLEDRCVRIGGEFISLKYV